ncbi:hypothetical protein D9758_016671 [Tetrapyrgos nigripes]|uniref:Uncharacterized protein n=1 Tax=Tetrapyrgos nigripes TaxID=182062 RepID=A0A8H5FI06_9AGAR|nr:hypothetical protein D9758_016671 [Tetrapyrgos nigripes]
MLAIPLSFSIPYDVGFGQVWVRTNPLGVITNDHDILPLSAVQSIVLSLAGQQPTAIGPNNADSHLPPSLYLHIDIHTTRRVLYVNYTYFHSPDLPLVHYFVVFRVRKGTHEDDDVSLGRREMTWR